MRSGILIAAAVALIGIGRSTAVAATYDAVTDFDGVDNPSGTWSYLYAPTVGGTLTPLTVASNLAGTGFPFFWTHQGVPDSVVVARNTGSTTASYETIVQPPNLLEVDPEIQVADVRWTSPATANYSVSGLFQHIDTGGTGHEVEILQDYNSASPILNDPIAGFGSQVPFSFSGTYNAGETLDFLVAYTNNFSNLSTGFDATITTVPEPTALALLAIGGVGMLSRRRNRRMGK